MKGEIRWAGAGREMMSCIWAPTVLGRLLWLPELGTRGFGGNKEWWDPEACELVEGGDGTESAFAGQARASFPWGEFSTISQ